MEKQNVTINLNFNLITLLFIILKVTDTVDWSWWLVLLPTWLPIALFLLGFAFFGFIYLLSTLFSK